MHQTTLAAHVRVSTGKGAARKLRRNNQMPAIFYGPGTQSIMLTVDRPELALITKQGGRENVILDLQITSDQGEQTKKVMLKDLMVDPIKGAYLHADFYEISMDKEITVNIPVRLVNTPVGVTNGGFLQSIRREIAISCLPDNMIDSFELDVSELDIGDALHVRDITFPEGISCADEEHLTVVVVSAPGGGGEEEEGAEEEIEEETEALDEETAEESKKEKKGGEQ